MSPFVIILAFVSITILILKGVDIIMRPKNRKDEVQDMLVYLVSAFLLYMGPYLVIFVWKPGLSEEDLSAHFFKLHLLVVVFFFIMLFIVWNRVRGGVEEASQGTVEKFTQEFEDLAEEIRQLEESLENVKESNEKAVKNKEKIDEMDSRLEDTEKELQKIAGEEVERAGASASVEKSPGGKGRESGRNDRDGASPGGASESGGRENLAEEHDWRELVEEYKQRREADRPPGELAEVLRALKEKGCKFGPNRADGSVYLQIRKYKENEREDMSAGQVDEDVEKALELAEVDF